MTGIVIATIEILKATRLAYMKINPAKTSTIKRCR